MEQLFWKVVISKEEYKILNCSKSMISWIADGLFDDFFKYVDEQFKEETMQYFKSGSDKWFLLVINKNRKKELFCIRRLHFKVEAHITFEIARFSDIMSQLNQLTDNVETYEFLASMYEDIYFEIDPKTRMIRLFNTISSSYTTGLFSVSKVISELKSRMGNDEEIDELQKYFSSSISHMIKEIGANLINNSKDIKSTLFEGQRIIHSNGTETIVGRAHPIRERHNSGISERDNKDALTGLFNKAAIMQICKNRIDVEHVANISLMIIDVDYFKNVNDSEGHAYGDIVLQKVGAVLQRHLAERGIAGRIGGDEFMVIYDDSGDEEILRNYLRNVKNQIRALFPAEDAEVPISLSIGTARYPSDASDYDSLFALADACLYLAKDKGRNRYIIYTKEKHGTLEDLRQKHSVSGQHIDVRGTMSFGDFLVTLQDDLDRGKQYLLNDIMLEYVQDFGIFNAMMFSERRNDILSWGKMCIKNPETYDQLKKIFLTSDYYDDKDAFYVEGSTHSIVSKYAEMRDYLLQCGICGYIRICFENPGWGRTVLVFTTVNNEIIKWNSEHYKFHRSLARILSEYTLE